MADVHDSWQSERGFARVYDSAVEREGVARAFGKLMWGTDTRRLFDAIASIRELPPGSSVLDVPCGGGLAFRALEPGHGLRYVAADLSPYMLERAQARARRDGIEGIEFTEADALAMPFEDSTFDLCVTFNGLHCLPDQPPAIAEFARVLKPRGTLRGTAVVDRKGIRQDAIIRLFRRISVFGQTTTESELRSMLETAGFERIDLSLSGALAHFTAAAPARVGSVA